MSMDEIERRVHGNSGRAEGFWWAGVWWVFLYFMFLWMGQTHLELIVLAVICFLFAKPE